MKTILFVCALSLSVCAHTQTLDRIVATVDNDLILESELNAQVQFYALNNKVDPATRSGLRIIREYNVSSCLPVSD